MRALKRAGLMAALATLSLGAGGCATVQPWERGVLAKPVMANEAAPHETAVRLHTYESKEGGKAATGVGGGGCGCN